MGMKLNRIPLMFPARQGGYDPDAALLFESAESEPGAFVPTYQKVATSDLYKAMKGGSINFYDYLGAGWIFLGGNKAAAKYEMKLGFNLTFMAGVRDQDFDQYGWTKKDINATNYAKTGYIPSDEIAAIDDCGISVYSAKDQTQIDNAISIGGGDGTNTMRFNERSASFDTQGRIGGSPDQSITTAAMMGYKSAHRAGTGDITVYLDGSEDSNAVASGALPTVELYIGAQNSSGVANFRYQGRISAAFVWKLGLTTAQEAEFRAMLKTWAIAMGRWIQPDIYDYAYAISEPSHKLVEAISKAWVDSNMTTALFALAQQAVIFNPKSAADSVIDMTGNQDALDVNAPALHADGKLSDGSTSYVNTQLILSNDKHGFGYYMIDAIGTTGTDYPIGQSVSSTQEGYVIRTSTSIWFEASNNRAQGTVDGTEKGMFLAYNDAVKDEMGIKLNGTLITATDTAANINMGAGNSFFVLGRNNAGSPTGLMDKRMLGYFVLTLAEESEYDTWGDFYSKIAENLGVDVHNQDMEANTSTYFEAILSDSSVYLGSQEALAKNKFIQEMVNSGQWAAADLVEIYGTIEQSDANVLHDLKSGTGLSGTYSNVNSGALDQEGHLGNGVDQHILTGYHVSADQSNVTILNNRFITAVKQAQTTNGYYCGANSTGNHRTIQLVRGSADAITYRPIGRNPDYITVNETGLGDSIGIIAMGKENYDSGAGTVEHVFSLDDIEKDRTSKAIAGLSYPATTLSVNAHYTDVTASSFSDGKVLAQIAGSNTLDKSTMTTILNNYELRLKGFRIQLAA